MSIHVAMNIARKDLVYAGVHRALKRDRIFAIYDILQGEGGEVLYPVPWARDASISSLATPADMRRYVEAALDEQARGVSLPFVQRDAKSFRRFNDRNEALP